MRWPLTVDQTIALGVGVPGVVAAVVAAIYAYRGYQFSRRQAAHDTAHRDTDLQPRLTEQWGGYPPGGRPAPLALMNTGGTALHFIWVGVDDRNVAMAAGPVPPHIPVSLAYATTDLGTCPYRTGRGTLLMIAQDIDERWWDCRTGIRLRGAADDYLSKRMAQVGLADLDERLRWHLPRSLPPEATHL